MPILENRIIERANGQKPPRLQDAAVGEMMKRAAFLLPADKLLVEMAVKNRLSYGQIARCLGIDSGTACRRMQRIARRINDPLVILLMDRICPLPDDHRQLGIEHFLQGRSIAKLAELHQMGNAEVRRMIDYIKGWHRGVSWRGRAR